METKQSGNFFFTTYNVTQPSVCSPSHCGPKTFGISKLNRVPNNTTTTNNCPYHLSNNHGAENRMKQNNIRQLPDISTAPPREGTSTYETMYKVLYVPLTRPDRRSVLNCSRINNNFCRPV